MNFINIISSFANAAVTATQAIGSYVQNAQQALVQAVQPNPPANPSDDTSSFCKRSTWHSAITKQVYEVLPNELALPICKIVADFVGNPGSHLREELFSQWKPLRATSKRAILLFRGETGQNSAYFTNATSSEIKKWQRALRISDSMLYYLRSFAEYSFDVDLSQIPLNEHLLKQLREAAPHITSLDVNSCYLGNCPSPRAESNLPVLVESFFACVNLPTSQNVALQEISKFSQLRFLDISYNPIAPDYFEGGTFSAISTLPHLKHLCFKQAQAVMLTPAYLTPFANQKLETLDISCNRISLSWYSDKIVKSLASMCSIKTLIANNINQEVDTDFPRDVLKLQKERPDMQFIYSEQVSVHNVGTSYFCGRAFSLYFLSEKSLVKQKIVVQILFSSTTKSGYSVRFISSQVNPDDDDKVDLTFSITETNNGKDVAIQHVIPILPVRQDPNSPLTYNEVMYEDARIKVVRNL